MKRILGLTLLIIMTAVWTSPSVAKKYRYIKREHGVKFQGNVPFVLAPMSLGVQLEGAYAYNWKGFMEVGPYFDLDFGILPGFDVEGWSAGLTGEYNFIKNRGRRKLIPSLGLQLGLRGGSELGLNANVGLHSSLKWFVATRTAFITTVQYDAATPVASFFSSLGHFVNLKMGFSHYFDFK